MTICDSTRSGILSAVIAFLGCSGVQASSETPGAHGGSPKDLAISFKLDPRLSGPTYGGERWVSPPAYIGATGQDTVEARAEAVGDHGVPVRVTLKWLASDAEMVKVSPAEGSQVKIAVTRAGESRVTVVSEGISKELVVKAKSVGPGLQIEIIQPAPKPAGASAVTPVQASAARESPFKSKKDERSYALGMTFGKGARKLSASLDEAMVAEGFRHGLAGSKTILTDEEAQGTLAGLQLEMNSQNASQNKADGESFLANNGKKEGVISLPSGLQYKVLRAGDGKKPGDADVVECHYRGTRIDGSEFDSSYRRSRPMTFAVAGLIPGWREAIKLMPAGSKWQLFVPAKLAYGERGIGMGGKSKRKSGLKIAPNSTLLFEVELLSVKAASDLVHQAAAPKPQGR